MGTTASWPAGRYGRRREPPRHRRLVLALLVTLTVLAGLAVAWRLYDGLARAPVRGEVRTFSIVDDDTVRITFEAVRDPGLDAVCVLRARSRDGAEVGRAEVALPTGGDERVTVTYTLATRARAVTGEVYGCGPRAEPSPR